MNCTWRYIEQPLDHFADPTTQPAYTYRERYCLYDGYFAKARAAGFASATDEMAPILFYTGNESPVEEYVNNTGLMWNLAKKMGCLVVFAEHRYEGDSFPAMRGEEDCVAGGTTAQALADYAALIAALKKEYKTEAPVIAFGGSYGGMLAGWFRIARPDVVAGSIAASAPVRMVASADTSNYKGGWEAIGRGMSKAGGATDNCFTNFRSIHQLAHFIGQSDYGLEVMNKAARRCEGSEFKSGAELLDWGGINCFFMAEGNYPFASTYIPFSMGIDIPFPPWPTRVGCAAGLDEDLGIKIDGDLANVKYKLTMGAFELDVDWTDVTGSGKDLTKQQVDDSRVAELIAGYVGFNAILANITGKDHCYGEESDKFSRDLAAAHARRFSPATSGADAAVVGAEAQVGGDGCPPCDRCPPCPISTRKQPPQVCNGTHGSGMSWGLVTCNENMHLAATQVRGVGGDSWWPPNQNRSWSAQTIRGPKDLPVHPTCTDGFAASGFYGGPQTVHSHGDWIAAYYGELNQTLYSNIVWSNGALDPWSGGGHYAFPGGISGPPVQNLTADGSTIALPIANGGHHLDLMFPTEGDPESVIFARKKEEEMIRRWSQAHYDHLGAA